MRPETARAPHRLSSASFVYFSQRGSSFRKQLLRTSPPVLRTRPPVIRARPQTHFFSPENSFYTTRLRNAGCPSRAEVGGRGRLSGSNPQPLSGPNLISAGLELLCFEGGGGGGAAFQNGGQINPLTILWDRGFKERDGFRDPPTPAIFKMLSEPISRRLLSAWPPDGGAFWS